MPASVIQALEPLTIQKIAAGEVVERPVNAVKELVENALDAGGTKIMVQIEDGGKELIRVSDNGVGMTRADVLRCWLPHTTSKIRSIEDLESATSFGFRGEALASMASVSELTVETRHWEEEVGTRLRVAESRPEEPEDCVRGRGTTISVRHLFRNNPVRRKFLAGGRTEGGRIAAMLSRLSLAHPEASFRLSDGSRELLHFPEGTLRRRAADVLGAHVLGELIEVDWEGNGFHVHGYVSEPGRFAGRPGRQHFFVNRRLVSSAGGLSRALAQAYESMPPGRFPVAALFLSLPPAEVDVNVHPSKREVRFLHEARAYWALSQALRKALRGAIAAPSLELSPSGVSAVSPLPEVPAFTYSPDSTESADSVPAGEGEGGGPSSPMLEFPGIPPASRASWTQGPEASAPGGCLQIHRGFIVVAVQSGFLLVNQRAAHERILYEKALENLRASRAASGGFSAQQLLFPELVDFPAALARLVEDSLSDLRALGFDLEPFGGATFQLKGLPAEVPQERARSVLRETVETMAEERREGRDESPAEEAIARLARAYAGAAAIPMGEPLDSIRMAALIDGLFATRNPYVSPTGAPAAVRYPLEDIRRRFGLRDADFPP